jgi:hypothetical protein
MSYLNEGASHVIVTSVRAHALNLCKLYYFFSSICGVLYKHFLLLCTSV